MEHKKMDDDMGFEMVDDEMGWDEVDEDLEYVKVEKTDADMKCEQKVDAEMEYEESVDSDIECEDDSEDEDVGYKEAGYDDSLILLCPFPQRRANMDLQTLVREIVLPFLPAKSLLRFRSISKEWDRWIRSPLLAHQQSYYFKDFSGYFCQYEAGEYRFVSLDNTAYGVPFQPLAFMPEYVSIISSCSGLLLCYGRDVLDTYYVCNPATQEWAQLPPPELYHGDKPSAVLAFEPSVLNMGQHYQLLCAVPMPDHVSFELYSSEMSSWKVSETILFEMEDSRIKGNSFYMKGVAYMETYTRKVIAFHLSTELYEVIQLPRWTPEDGVLTQVQGELCYIGLSCLSQSDYSVMIYAGMDLRLRCRMEVKIGPEFKGLPQQQYRVLPCLDGDNVMILVGSVVYCCNLGDQSVKEVARVGDTDSLASPEYLAYVNSLVPVAKPSVLLT